MLISCPECEMSISDKAVMCPHCGYPMKPDKNIPKRRSRKRKRLPNGFGQISEIKGRNLRKPFRAMVTVGKTPEGRPICKPLKPESYFLTYNDAYAALIDYNRKPYSLDNDITMKELYERWFESYKKKGLADNTINAMKHAWEYCSAIYDVKVTELRVRHIRYCMNEGCRMTTTGEESHASPITQYRIKLLFNMLLDYAVEYEITDKNVSRAFKLPKEVSKEMKVKTSHIPYTDDEINILWKNLDYPFVDMLLIQCYSGWRPLELCDLKISDVDLVEESFTGGVKTEAGKDRKVPIHPNILPLVTSRYEQAVEVGQEYLFSIKKPHGYVKLQSTNLTYHLKKIVTEFGLNPEHKPHDGRVHFVTQAKKYNVDEYAIKYIVGHAISDLTEKVYTKRDFEWIKSEMQKIK